MFNQINQNAGAYNNVIAWYPLFATNGNDLRCRLPLVKTGTPASQTGPAGVSNTATGPFDGSNYFLNSSAAFNTAMSNKSNYIIDYCINFPSSPAGLIWLDYAAAGSNFTGSMWMRGSGAQAVQWANDPFDSVVTSTNFITFGVWYRITMRATNGTNKKLYVNGVLNVNGTAACGLTTTGNRLYLGRWNGAGGANAQWLSDVKVIGTSNLADIPRRFLP